MWMLGSCTTFLIKQEVWYSLGNTARGSGMFFIISSLFVGLHHILSPFFAVATALFCRSCFICNTTPLYFVFGSLKLFSDIQNQWVLRDQGRPRSPRGNVHRWDGRKRKAPASEPPQIVRTAQKGTYVGKHEVLSGEASRQRRLSSFELDAFMVVEVDIAVNHLVGFRESSWFVAVNALCLED